MSKILPILFLLGATFAGAQVSSVDSGAAARTLAGWDEALLQEWGGTQSWLRIRSRPDPGDPTQESDVAAEQVGLARLSALGFKPIPFLRWSPSSWFSGVRPGNRQRLPLDLREAYRRGYAYGKTYGAAVAGFEIENEPDISFVGDNAETYLAFQKALYLGLKRGVSVALRAGEDKAEPAKSNQLKAESADYLDTSYQLLAPRQPLGRPADRWMNAGRRAADHQISSFKSQVLETGAPLIVMAPLALPPGPYFEQLVANGLFSYTDAFNYHYYGYAEDFTGVYEQFAHAVRELEDSRSQIADRDREQGNGEQMENTNFKFRAPNSVKRTLPVLLTEYGYGSLTDPDRNTVEGRVRQWRWFKSVGEQIQQLRIDGPMAFYVPPYYENNSMEFGLTVRSADGAFSDHPEAGSDPALQFKAGNLTFTPADFDLTKPEPWMEQIGRKFGDNEATPALAWLYEQGLKHPYQPKNWNVAAPPPSPVVIDFIAGQGLVQMKRYGGYLAMQSGEGPPSSRLQRDKSPGALLKAGSGELVLYNFSNEPVRGVLRVTEGRELVADPGALEGERRLEPMERLVIPVDVRVPSRHFVKHDLHVRFVGAERGADDDLSVAADRVAARSRTPNTELPAQKTTAALFSTAFYPDATGMRETVLEDFKATGEVGTSAANRAWLQSRPRAGDEPRLEPNAGRWLTTRGLEVAESSDGAWKFTVRAFPPEPNRPAMAELPLADDFVFPDEGMMKMIYRLLDPPGADLKSGQYFELYFRTANGNLYQVWPRQYAMAAWQGYTEVKKNYTMAFYGRTNLPWRFAENRPVSLVFFFRPLTVPATYEIKDARIVKLGSGD